MRYTNFVKNVDENNSSSDFGVDPDLLNLLGDGGITLRDLECVHDWRRGFDEERIAAFYEITVPEVKAGIERIVKKLPESTVRLDTELRDQIVANNARMKRNDRELSGNLELSADTLLQNGKNPIQILKRYREALTEEDTNLIEILRQADKGIDDVGESADPTLEREARLIEELRQQEKIPKINAVSNRSISQNSEDSRSRIAGNKLAGIGDPKKNNRWDRRSKRITVRIENALLERIQKHTHNDGYDLSKLVRVAINQYLESSAEDGKK